MKNTDMQLETSISSDFFARLRPFRDFAGISNPANYTDAPADWHLAITDVVGSTRAVASGRYRDVNALGVASIVALCNAAPYIQLPFVFGGDGATALLPGAELAAYQSALRGVQQVARDAFGLDMRAGLVPVADLVAAGYGLRVARFRAASNVCMAMFAGSGIDIAEAWIKDPQNRRGLQLSSNGDAQADFSGFECRWQPVVNRNGVILSLLVRSLASDEDAALKCYRGVLDYFGKAIPEADCHPLAEQNLHLQPLRGDYAAEARLISGSAQGASYRAAWRRARRLTQLGRMLIGLGLRAGEFDGSGYRQELLINSDYRRFDATLRMVLDLTEEQVLALENYLENARQAKQLVYGMHRSATALMTCFVRSYQHNHMHFIDGADGGCFSAAKQLKQQLQQLRT